jgi:hypothetical protein
VRIHTLYLAIGALALLSCSGGPPEILDVELYRIYVRDPATQEVSSRLGLFVGVEDPDGYDDIAHLYLINDQAELYWSLDPSTWQKGALRGQDWIGSYGLALPPEEVAPPGEYRILLEDLGGESAEVSRALPAPPVAPPPFPEASEAWSAKPGPTEIWAFDSQGALLGAVPAGSMDSTLEEATAEFYLFRRYPERTLAVATGPIYP